MRRRGRVRLEGILDEASPVGDERLAGGLLALEAIPVEELAVAES